MSGPDLIPFPPTQSPDDQPGDGPTVTVELGPATLQVLLRLAQAAEGLAASVSQVNMPEVVSDVQRVLNDIAPPPSGVVGTEYVARSLGVSKTWVADLVRNGEIPASCIVPGTGNGRAWKFYRSKLDRWMSDR